MNKSKAVIVAAVRTPLGSFLGSLSSVPATELGAIAIKGALAKANVAPDQVEEVYMGQVLQANAGQAPARQAALKAGISDTTPCTTVNKVCASGLKAVMLAAQTIELGDADIIVAGGMENMSLAPHYAYLRKGHKYGNMNFVDGLAHDGLTDPYNQSAMGIFADQCAEEYNLSREDQDQYAISSYQKSQAAWEQGLFTDEIVPVSIPQRKGDPIIVDKDEECFKVNFEKLKKLRPAFSKEGTVTAANASTINDGASALVIMSASKAESLGLTPIASIESYADAAQAPEKFTTAPALALPKALKKANLSLNDIDLFEVNEAFSVVALANQKALEIPLNKLNVRGGAVSIGHPLGCSGARILTTLLHTLKDQRATYGAASICNGGGGASSLIIKSC